MQPAHTSITTLIVAVAVPGVSLLCACVIAVGIIVAVLLARRKKANRKITSPKKTKEKKLDNDYELFNVNGDSHVYEIVGNKNSLPMKKKNPDIYSNIHM